MFQKLLPWTEMTINVSSETFNFTQATSVVE